MRNDLERPELKEVIYETFLPTLDPNSPIATNIDLENLPCLDGFYGSQLKSGVTAMLTKGNLPLYAQWQYGNGTVGSFLCDLNGTWSADFITSDTGAAIVNNIVSHLTNAAESDAPGTGETPQSFLPAPAALLPTNDPTEKKD